MTTTDRVVVSTESSAVVVLLSASTRTSVITRNRANADCQTVSSPWYSRQPQHCSSELADYRAIGEIIQPVVELNVTIACITAEEVAAKDLATGKQRVENSKSFGKSRVGHMS